MACRTRFTAKCDAKGCRVWVRYRADGMSEVRTVQFKGEGARTRAEDWLEERLRRAEKRGCQVTRAPIQETPLAGAGDAPAASEE